MLLLAAFHAVGQEVVFANTTLTPPPDRLVRGMDGFGLIGTNWCAQLYYGPDERSLSPVNAPPRHFYDGTTTLPGVWNGARRTLNGFAPGEMAILRIKVWDCALFEDFDTAVTAGGIYGTSMPFSYAIPATGSPISEFWMHNFVGFTLVPEPTTTGLLVISGAVLFLRFRRRKWMCSNT